MTYGEIRDMVMIQSGNDASDYTEYEPALSQYINEGYGNILYEYNRSRISTEEEAEYPYLTNISDVPKLPEYMHRPIADYATFMMYRNGNVTKQSRGNNFYSQYMNALGEMRRESIQGLSFTNLYNEQEY